MPINQPSNQIKLTNVSLVRLKKNKKRLEIACYKNKVLEWRSGVETDLDNVLQIKSIFVNVSKGQTASSADLVKAFGPTATINEMILEILSRGELQVGEKERQAKLERVHNEMISIIASKLVDPKTKRVYTPSMIEKALDMLSSKRSQTHQDKNTGRSDGDVKSQTKEQIWTGVVTTKSAKIQALDAMKALIKHQPIPVARARMRLRIICPISIIKQISRPCSTKVLEEKESVKCTIKDRILAYVEEVEAQDIVGSDWIVKAFVEPGSFKGLSDFVGNETMGQGRIELIELAIDSDE